ncbi:precorrin-3B synthase [Amycolatopsis xylanica]|uniref:Precorrin-3B synthase n=1 Tax=Amycolatopsis xylanica TaxID=589385 RepID=A0A1H3N899_9PSEU|nr:precorrin-3B synthase [Amycolatopsis xylanica]SDY85068.1 precorrin-3B synthase [Amycolatopsis xylanica]
MDTPARARADVCPGVFAPHDAADGALARVRLPGGVVTSDQLHVLAECADAFADGELHLTSRGNLQLRGLDRSDTRLAQRLAEAGLLPSPSHERVRNILASPRGEAARALAADLDVALCARPELAALPGRFLFAFDDGRGDVAGEGADVCWRDGAILLAGTDTGKRVPADRAVEALLQVASMFLKVREGEWRISELPDASVLADALPGPTVTPVDLPVHAGIPIGLLDDGAAVAPEFGVLTSARLRLFAELAPFAVVTPWRSVFLPGVRDAEALRGMLTERGVTACIGSPGCAKSRADVRADARRVSGVRAHFAGCERRCGKPAAGHIDVLAEEDGYRVDGTWVPVGELTDFLLGQGAQ